jgi:Ca2+-binding EF-hand superfamily protein
VETLAKLENAAGPAASAEELEDGLYSEYVDALSENEVVFEFQLTDFGDNLKLTAFDVESLELILATSGLNEYDPSDIFDILSACSAAGGLDKAGFDEAMRTLIDGEGLTDEEKSFLTFSLTRIFFAFDRNNAGFVELDEFFAGMCLFACGNKSDKLSMAFETFIASTNSNENITDEKTRAGLTVQELWRFIRSFLTMLAALNEDNMDKPRSDLDALVDAGAMDVTERVFQWLMEASGQNMRINFEQFANWYTEGGFRYSPWLELLDTRKWSMGNQVQEIEPEAEQGEQSSEKIAPVVVMKFEVPLSLEKTESIPVTEEDIENLSALLSLTTLNEQRLMDLHDSLLAVESAVSSNWHVLDKACFDECMRTVVPAHELSNAEKSFLSFALSKCFYAYDRSGDAQQADFVEFTSGIGLLTAGTLDEKMSIAFALFDSDGSGYLTRRELCSFVRSLLTIALALTSHASSFGSKHFHEVVDRGAAHITQTVFVESSREQATKISFLEFFSWYEMRGEDCMPWVEIIQSIVERMQ